MKHQFPKFKLTLLCVSILWMGQANACVSHDHGCVFHGIGIPRTPDVTNTGTSLNIVSWATKTNTSSNKSDFDNTVLLPQGVGPYVISTTGYPLQPSQPYQTASEHNRAVYPSQYAITFAGLTAIAKHSGDFNGGEPIRAGQTGCGSSAACEEVKITGNVPDGVYRQTNHLFNYYNVPGLQVDVTSMAYATGKGVVVSTSHISNPRYTATLSGNRTDTTAKSPEYSYTFQNREYNPHAVGVALFSFHTKNLKNSVLTEDDTHIYRKDTYRHVTGDRVIRALADSSATPGYHLGTEVYVVKNLYDESVVTSIRKAIESPKKVDCVIVFGSCLPVQVSNELVANTKAQDMSSSWPSNDIQQRLNLNSLSYVDQDYSFAANITYGSVGAVDESIGKTRIGKNYKLYFENERGNVFYRGTTALKPYTSIANKTAMAAGLVIGGAEIYEEYQKEGKYGYQTNIKAGGVAGGVAFGAGAGMVAAAVCTATFYVCVPGAIIVGGFVGWGGQKVTEIAITNITNETK